MKRLWRFGLCILHSPHMLTWHNLDFVVTTKLSSIYLDECINRSSLYMCIYSEITHFFINPTWIWILEQCQLKITTLQISCISIFIGFFFLEIMSPNFIGLHILIHKILIIHQLIHRKCFPCMCDIFLARKMLYLWMWYQKSPLHCRKALDYLARPFNLTKRIWPHYLCCTIFSFTI